VELAIANCQLPIAETSEVELVLFRSKAQESQMQKPIGNRQSAIGKVFSRLLYCESLTGPLVRSSHGKFSEKA
jgi:hypothetical protein